MLCIGPVAITPDIQHAPSSAWTEHPSNPDRLP